MAQAFRRQFNCDLLAGISSRHSKCAEFFTRRQWLNGRFSESGLSHDDGRTNKHGPYFARVLLKRCEGKEQCLI